MDSVEFTTMARTPHYPLTKIKACHVLYIVKIEHKSQTHAAIHEKLNVGTVNHVVHRRRFPDAVPIPPDLPGPG
jgi:hypothetical protein